MKTSNSDIILTWLSVVGITVLLLIIFGGCSRSINLLETEGKVIDIEGNRVTILFKESEGEDYRYDHFYVRRPDSVQVGDGAEIIFKRK